MLKAIQSAALVAQYFLLFLLRRKQMHLNLRLRVFLAHCLKPCLVLKTILCNDSLGEKLYMDKRLSVNDSHT
jgi:hypothetical protein